MKRLISTFILFFSFLLSTFPIPFVSQKIIPNDHENVQGRITNIIQDKNGLIWFSTFNGLHSYDGYDIVKYKSYPLVSNRIQRIYDNANGDIWCISANKVYLFKSKEGKFIDIQPAFEKNSPTNINISNIYPLSNGVTWMVSTRGECYRFQDNDPLNSCERMTYLFSTDTNVTRIELDSEGKEWIISKNGIFIYGRHKTVSNIPFYYTFEKNGTMWLATYDGRMATFDKKTEQLKDFSLSVKINQIHHMTEAADSIIYTSTDQGLFAINTNTRQSQQICKEPIRYFNHIDKEIWGTTSDYRICHISENGNFSYVSLPEGVTFNNYRVTIQKYEQGDIWASFYENCNLLYYNPESNSFELPSNHEFISQQLSGHFIDREGNHWYRLDHALIMTTPHSTPFKIENPENGSEVRSMMTDKQQRLWIGFRNECITIYDTTGDKTVKYLSKDGSLTNRHTTCNIIAYTLMQDSQNRIWIGCKRNGLYLLTPTDNPQKYNISHYSHDINDPNSLRNNQVYTIIEDSQKRIWIGTLGGGLHLWNDGEFIHFENGLGTIADNKPLNIRHLYELHDSIITVCGKEGFFTFNTHFTSPSQIHFFHNGKNGKPHSLSENDVMSIYPSKKGDIYLCTVSGGINRIISDKLLSDEIEFECFSQNEGLASDVVYSAIEDSYGYIWLTGINALTRFNTQTFETEIYDISHFGEKQTFSEAIPLNVNERLCFGTTTGFLHFPQASIKPRCETLPLVFTGLDIQQKPAFERIQNGTLKLSPEERHITLKYAALNYSKENSRIRYAYKLEGIDQKWNYTNEHIITYLSLPSGKKTFHIRSTNEYGVWTNNDLLLDIIVTPRFFESIWGQLTILALILLITVTIVYFYRRFYLLRHRLSTEKEMTDIKLRFFTDISHELRTPLTLIDGPITEMLKDKSMSGKNRTFLELMEKNTKRMLLLVNQILDFRKLQNKRMDLILEPTNIIQELRCIMNNFQTMAQQHHIDFQLIEENNCHEVTLWIDRDKFEKTFFNLLSNAFKYTPDNKRITVTVQSRTNKVEIAVKDEGIGIPPEHLDGLFKRFETILKDNMFKASSGIGLSLAKQFVELHHGHIKVNSKPNEGSCFTVEFLTGREHFATDNVEYIIGEENHDEITSEEPILETENGKDEDEKDSRPVILLVEDNDDVRHFIHTILYPHYQIVEATNGEEGYKRGKECWPELIISDVMMPIMDGYALLEALRKDADLYAVPVILLTAKTAIDSRIQSARLGADDYITKPFSANYLTTKVAALIEQRRLLKTRFLESLHTHASDNGNEYKIAKELEPTLPDITPTDELFIKNVMKVVEKQMDNSTFNLNEFANALNMGRTSFNNKFKSILGLSPMDFVFDMRMKRAKQLLSCRQFTIAEIAYQTGFNNPKYFSTCFKKHYGQRPTDFMKQEDNNDFTS